MRRSARLQARIQGLAQVIEPVTIPPPIVEEEEVEHISHHTMSHHEDEDNHSEHSHHTNEDDQSQRGARCTLADYARPKLEGAASSIVRRPVNARNFELKPNMIQMVQNGVVFNGIDGECPSRHLKDFLEICDTVKNDQVHPDCVRLRLFPFSLKGRAKSWLENQPSRTFTTWEGLAEAFLEEFFPPYMTDAIRDRINHFTQHKGELFHETWNRFQS